MSPVARKGERCGMPVTWPKLQLLRLSMDMPELEVKLLLEDLDPAENRAISISLYRSTLGVLLVDERGAASVADSEFRRIVNS